MKSVDRSRAVRGEELGYEAECRTDGDFAGPRPLSCGSDEYAAWAVVSTSPQYTVRACNRRVDVLRAPPTSARRDLASECLPAGGPSERADKLLRMVRNYALAGQPAGFPTSVRPSPLACGTPYEADSPRRRTPRIRVGPTGEFGLDVPSAEVASRKALRGTRVGDGGGARW